MEYSQPQPCGGSERRAALWDRREQFVSSCEHFVTTPQSCSVHWEPVILPHFLLPCPSTSQAPSIRPESWHNAQDNVCLALKIP